MSSTTELLQKARQAARILGNSSTKARNDALEAMADSLVRSEATILSANQRDVAAAREAKTSPALLDRLALNESRFEQMVGATQQVVFLPDPLAEVREFGTRPNGLRVQRRRVPLGVLAIIYEARPNVTVETAALAIKSGNAIVLRGGKEAMASNAALVTAVQRGIEQAGLPRGCVQLIEDTSRQRVAELLSATGKVDLVIPRGGEKLMKMVDELAKVPVIRHGQGITHVFVDRSADPAMSEEIVYNSKVQRPGVCNALETLLLHRDWANGEGWPKLASRLAGEGKVQLRVDSSAAEPLRQRAVPYQDATPTDWDTEFLALVLAVKTVDSLDQALEHIAGHGTHHTASILTNDEKNAERFLREVDASCVLWNASTRFNDGGELGLGAEMGISTSKLHAFGPMGLRELTTEKFVVYGAGQTRS